MAAINDRPLEDEAYYPYLVKMAQEDGYEPDEIGEVLIIPMRDLPVDPLRDCAVYLTCTDGHKMTRIVRRDELFPQGSGD